ncbi:MAG: cupin domain-containing protein [Reyranella sp.]|nr:cupin domain-containing protein [Reyranella sp.]
MGNFQNIGEILQHITRATVANSTAVKPLAVGQDMAAAVVRSARGADGLHRQPHHEELLIVLEGEGDFRVGEETRSVKAGDFIFVPRDTVHGTVATRVEPLSYLSMISPRIDLQKDVIWHDEAPKFQVV